MRGQLAPKCEVLTEILAYLERTYVRKVEEFAKWAIKRYRNFGTILTSHLEGLHAQMKSYLINRLGSLKRLGDAIETFLDKKQSDYYTALENQGSKTKSAYKTTEMTMLVALDISWKALDLIWAQYSAEEAQFLQGKEMPRDCMGLFRKQ